MKLNERAYDDASSQWDEGELPGSNPSGVHLPKELRGVVTSVPEPAESFGLDEFVGRVAEREHVDRDTAYAHVDRADEH